MEYRAVGNRCAVLLDSLARFIPPGEIMTILNRHGFEIVEIDIVSLARQCIGKSKYRRQTPAWHAPAVVDCSSFIKWLYGNLGIWLPRRSIQQREYGEPIGIHELKPGDALFTSSRFNYFDDDPAYGVGHVGIVSGDGTVIHASYRKSGVNEDPIDHFLPEKVFRGARRFLPKNETIITLQIPPHKEVEFADDIKWIVLESLPVKKKEETSRR